MKKLQVFCGLSVVALALASGRTAAAQTDTPPASSPPATSTVVVNGRGGSHLGVGGVAYLAGVGGGPAAGLSLAYDPGAWHLDTVFGWSAGTPANDVLLIGARGWYHLHRTSASDFSLGGGFSYLRSAPDATGAEASNALFIEAGALIRVFLAQNVALSAGAGLVIGAVDAEGVAIGPANLLGSTGIHYYF